MHPPDRRREPRIEGADDTVERVAQGGVVKRRGPRGGAIRGMHARKDIVSGYK